MRNTRALLAFWILLGFFGFSCLLPAKVGFGLIRKKGIELKVRQPAAVRLANTTIAFVGASTNVEYTPVQKSLLTNLATELISHEKTLIVKPEVRDAEWTLWMDVTGYSCSPPVNRTESSGGTTISYVRWNGSLDVAYRVLDQAGRVHDAGNVPFRYSKEFETSETGTASKGGWLNTNPLKKTWRSKKNSEEEVPASTEDVKQILVRGVVGQIASKLGNTTQAIDVNVAAGEEHLDHAAEFMSNGLWSRALDEIQKTPTFDKPDEEAFHQYDLGLIYEAMSYESKDGTEQRANIFKAAEYYDKALELNPNEKYFVETIARTRDSINHYKALDEMLAQDKKDEDARKNAAVAPAKPINVTDVIEMHNGGVSDDQLIEYIRNSKVVFNPFDKDTIMEIAKAKLPVPVQNELRAKVGAPPLGQAVAKKTK